MKIDKVFTINNIIIIYFRLNLFIIEREKIPPNVVPKNEIPPKEPNSVSDILKYFFISVVDADIAPWSKFPKHNNNIQKINHLIFLLI